MEKVRVIVTARAIILNSKGELLLVSNSENGIWFAPGGWVDGFETLEETCVREVYEETGVKVKPVKLLKIGYFRQTKEQNIKWKENINKIEHYFLCEIVEGEFKIGAENKNLWQDEDTGNTEFIKFFTPEELQKFNVVPEWIKKINFYL